MGGEILDRREQIGAFCHVNDPISTAAMQLLAGFDGVCSAESIN